jgi:uncharacterized glyoxalase superfamily protein PhnB
MTMRPDRYRNAGVPHIRVDGASDGIAFYKRELFRMAHPNGKILHAEILIAGSVVMIGDPDDRLYSEPRALGRGNLRVEGGRSGSIYRVANMEMSEALR